MGRSWRRAGYGCPSAPPRIRFPTSSTPDTISRRLHPGHGCSPDIATHGPRPREGAGEERRRRGRGGGGRQKSMGSLLAKARAGWGCQQKRKGIPCRRRGRGGGAGRRIWVSFAEGAGGVGAAGRSAWASSYRGAGGVGEAGRSVWVSLPKARVGCRRRTHRFSPFRDAGRERCPGRQRIGLQSLSLSAASISTVPRHNLPGIEDKSV